jgi:hypothetical protein
MEEKITEIRRVVDGKFVNRLEFDVQNPIGCFDLAFLSAFTLCYHKPTNIIARIGPASGPTNHSLLINCHLDTLPDTPGILNLCLLGLMDGPSEFHLQVQRMTQFHVL